MTKSFLHGLVGAGAFLAVIGLDDQRRRRLAEAAHDLKAAAEAAKDKARSHSLPAADPAAAAVPAA